MEAVAVVVMEAEVEVEVVQPRFTIPASLWSSVIPVSPAVVMKPTRSWWINIHGRL